MNNSSGAAMRIDGKAVAQSITDGIAAEVATAAFKPGLGVILVGDDPASAVYVRNKQKMAERCGFHSTQITLPAGTTQAELIGAVEGLNNDPLIHGILVQLPLPRGLDSAAVIDAIHPDKDVDGLHVVNAGRLVVGDRHALVPCTPLGSMRLIRDVRGDDLSGLSAVVIGRSRLVGMPLALLLTQANATVTVAHSRTADLPAVARGADILVAAVGRPQMVKGDWIKPGATVIDVGINRIDDPSTKSGTRLVGDVAYDEAAAPGVAGAITPVPGGVGPMTIAMLMGNTLTAATRAQRS
ncbi:MAG: bifunctional methylenetetrahydrofolate dehydrogenase/methenyltetrahydrofolate cyclohydrolase FolD [Pseudomonadota bacterium]